MINIRLNRIITDPTQIRLCLTKQEAQKLRDALTVFWLSERADSSRGPFLKHTINKLDEAIEGLYET